MEWLIVIAALVWYFNGAIPTKVREEMGQEQKYQPQLAENKLQKDFDTMPPPS